MAMSEHLTKRQREENRAEETEDQDESLSFEEVLADSDETVDKSSARAARGTARHGQ